MVQVYTFIQVGWQVRMLHRCSIHFLCYRMISQLFNCYFWNYFSMYVYMNLCVISEVVSLLLNFVTLTMNDTITTLASLHGGSWFEAVQLTGIRAVASSIEKKLQNYINFKLQKRAGLWQQCRSNPKRSCTVLHWTVHLSKWKGLCSCNMHMD